MKKPCPACGQPIADESKQFCSKCEKLPQVSGGGFSAEDFERLSQHVSKNLKDDWKFKAQIAIAVIVLVLAIIGIIDAIVGFNLKENMAAHFQKLEIQATNRINERLVGLDDDVRKALAQVDVQMRSNIASRFEGSNVQAIIHDVAKVEAKDILESEVQPAVKSFKEDALFIRTIARAQGYDFKAYQRLLEIETETNDNARLANQVIAEIDRSLARDRSDFSPRRHYVFVSGTNFYEGPFTSDELAIRFSHVAQDQTPFNREGFINSVGDLKQPLFLPQLIEFFTNETDLAVADRSTIAISDLAKQDFHPRDFERIVTWWNDHHSSYTNWPFSELDHGFGALLRSSFDEAAKSFQDVLNVDPSADMSRAFAIKCYFEIGETNKALELSKGFKEPTGRWAQWASAITELETGSISNATVKFADLSKMNPVMQIRPQEGLFFWRKLDWPLFHKLTSNEK